MEKQILSPKEILLATEDIAVKKANGSFRETAVLGIMAGLFIAIGASASLVISQTLGNIDLGVSKSFGAFAFTVGIVLVLLAGSQLFTGNILLFAGVLSNKISTKQMIKNWLIIYFSNFVGAVLFALIIYFGSAFNKDTQSALISTVNAKLSKDFFTVFIKGIACNILVCGGVWIATGAKDSLGKMFTSAFPVFIFVLIGFEHCVANMYYFPQAFMYGWDISMFKVIVHNLIPVTLGNIVGGCFIALMYHLAYKEEK